MRTQNCALCLNRLANNTMAAARKLLAKVKNIYHGIKQEEVI